MRLLFLLFLCLLSSHVEGQAEYQKVREMFSVPHTNINIHVLKGHLDHVHPVEFFIGQRGESVKGYYRLVSSGDVFMLEGEWNNKQLNLTESSESGLQLGSLSSDHFDFEKDELYTIQWISIANRDVLDFTIRKTAYSSYPPLAFKASISKFCDYQINDCFTIEVFEENKAEIVYMASAKRETIELQSHDPLSFKLSDSTIYEELSDKLRANKKDGFHFYTKENRAEVKRIYYASQNLLSDVEFPVLGNEKFDKFILDIINKEKAKTKLEIKRINSDKEIFDDEIHFQCKWNGWTEIDYLGSSMVSGRIILQSFMQDKTENKVIPFTYDLFESESIKVKDQFKTDVDIQSFFSKRIIAEVQNNKSFQGKNVEDFKYYSFSDNYVLISTAHNPQDGIAFIKIPYTEIQNWVKRTSLIKKIMRA